MPVEGVATLQEIGNRLAQVGANVTDRNVMAGIGSYMEGATLHRMDKAVAPDGTKHKPLSRRWLNYKRTGINSEDPESWIATVRTWKGKRKSRSPNSIEARYNLSRGTRKGWKAKSPNIWQFTGDSRRKLQTIKVTKTTCVVRINTKYSGYANAERQVLGMSQLDRRILGGGVVADLKARVEGQVPPTQAGGSGRIPDGR